MRLLYALFFFTIFLASCTRPCSVTDDEILGEISSVSDKMIADNPDSAPLSSREIKCLVDQLIKEHGYFWVTFDGIKFPKAIAGLKNPKKFKEYCTDSMLGEMLSKNPVYIFFGPPFRLQNNELPDENRAHFTEFDGGELSYCVNTEQFWAVCDILSSDASYNWRGEIKVNCKDLRRMNIMKVGAKGQKGQAEAPGRIRQGGSGASPRHSKE